MLKVYGYSKCSTCVKAKKYLTQKGTPFEDIEITENPPSKAVLKKALKSGDYQLKDLFNKSGMVYREMNLKEKLPKMTEEKALELLSGNGKLIKRPFATDGKSFTVGFREAAYKEKWGN